MSDTTTQQEIVADGIREMGIDNVAEAIADAMLELQMIIEGGVRIDCRKHVRFALASLDDIIVNQGKINGS